MMVIREDDRAQLKTKGGLDYTKRYHRGALKLRVKQFVLDGDAVVLNLHGLSDFIAASTTTRSSTTFYGAGW